MAKLIINTQNKKSTISKNIYGHFSEHLGRCIYEGMYVGENSDIPNTNGMRNDVVEALREIKVPVLRWPGGCFADEYHWKDGIGPKETRKKMINTHWGGVLEDNSFGTHEFMELCRQIGCDPYVNGNVGSGTVQEMSEWVEYMTFEGISPMADLRKENGHEEPWDLTWFAVGNENWGCGGNMRPEYYADEYRRYQTYVRNYRADKKVKKIACGANREDYEWTRAVMENLSNHGKGDPSWYMDGLSLHCYTSFGEKEKRNSLNFDTETYYDYLGRAYFIKQLVEKHGAIMDFYDPQKKVGMMVDEWGTWYDVEPGTNPGFLYQQNTMRDAMVAALTLDIFNKHSDRVKMANIAQIVNVLQSVILTEGEKMIKTPTYFVYRMYRDHQESTLLDSMVEGNSINTGEGVIPQISESVSVAADGKIHITMSNLSASDAEEVEIDLLKKAVKSVCGEILTNEIHAHNTFEEPDTIGIQELKDMTVNGDKITVTLPACSLVHLVVE